VATSVDIGSVREVWFSTVATPGTKYSFLIRDDTFVKAGQTFGRSIRLGDPIDTGSSSGWRQLSWEGGSGQYRWRDAQMYRDGAPDPQTYPGKIRMWPAFQDVYAHYSRPNERYVLSKGNLGNGDRDTTLWMGESSRDYKTGYGNPGGGYALIKYIPSTGQNLPVKFFTSGIASMSPRQTDDGTGSHILDVTTQGASPNGQYWTVIEDTNVTGIVQDTNAPNNGFAPDSLVSFGGATYYCQSTWLGKRVPLAPYGTNGTHTKVKEIKGALATRGLAVWQNRLWFGVQYSGGLCRLYTSDGVSTSQAVEFPDEFLIRKIVAHYGALYIAGERPHGLYGSGTRGQIWKYTGSSLTKLWEEGNGTNGKTHSVTGMCTFGQNLVWGHHGLASNQDDLQTWPNKRPGLMFYDAEKDAIFEGPFLDMDSSSTGVYVTDVISWNNTLAVSAFDEKKYAAPNLYPSGVFVMRDVNKVRMNVSTYTWATQSFAKNLAATRSTPVTSSVYEGPDDVHDVDKVWLSVSVHCRLAAANAQIRVAAITNESGTEQAVGTIAFDGSKLGWRIATLPMKAGGDYISGQTIQYRLYLENTDTGAQASTAQAEVDSLELKWLVKPTKQRTWRIRAVCEDAQLRLDGSANPQTLAQTMADRLELLWSSAVPFNLYEPQASGGGPSGSAIEVTAKDFNIQSYRVEDTDPQVVQEVTMTLVEVV